MSRHLVSLAHCVGFQWKERTAAIAFEKARWRNFGETAVSDNENFGETRVLAQKNFGGKKKV